MCVRWMTGSHSWPCYWAQMESGIWASGTSWAEVTHEPPRVTEKEKTTQEQCWIYDVVSATGYGSGPSFSSVTFRRFVENELVQRSLSLVTLSHHHVKRSLTAGGKLRLNAEDVWNIYHPYGPINWFCLFFNSVHIFISISIGQSSRCWIFALFTYFKWLKQIRLARVA